MLLAQQLGLPRVELDEIRWPYYEEAGYDADVARAMVEGEAGILGLLAYCKPFEAHAVARVIEDQPDSVIDFGAGHSVYEDDALFARVERALVPVPHVILLLPSPDPDQSITILNERFAKLLQHEVGQVDAALLALNARFVRHPSNVRLAKQIVYTEGKTPEETTAEIVALIKPA